MNEAVFFSGIMLLSHVQDFDIRQAPAVRRNLVPAQKLCVLRKMRKSVSVVSCLDEFWEGARTRIQHRSKANGR